jgi:ribosomal protein L31E
MSLRSTISFGLVVVACAAPVFAQQSGGRLTPQASTPELTQPVDEKFVPVVESKTQALEVLSVTRRDFFLRVRIKNVSDKNIYSFRMSYHKSGQSQLFSFVMSDTKTALAPGEVYKYDHSFIPESTLAREPLTFEAVLFEDGTGDGIPQKVKSLQDLFLANRKELEHVIALFRTAIKAPDIESMDGLQSLLGKVSETPEYSYGVDLSGLAGLTLASWKATAMHMIRDIVEKKLKDENVNIKAELTSILEGFNKALAKYPGTI